MLSILIILIIQNNKFVKIELLLIKDLLEEILIIIKITNIIFYYINIFLRFIKKIQNTKLLKTIMDLIKSIIFCSIGLFFIVFIYFVILNLDI